MYENVDKMSGLPFLQLPYAHNVPMAFYQLVDTVHPSSQNLTPARPAFIIGSMAITIPSSSLMPAPRLP
jgi:hypothetical protein